MRIISKFKDFYDSAQSMGIDKSIVYERKFESIAYKKPSNYDSIINSLIFHPFGSIFFNNKKDYLWNNKSKYSNEVYLIGFCGKLFLAYNFLDIAEGEIIESKTFFSPESILDYYQKLTIKHKDSNPVCFNLLRERRGTTPPTKRALSQSFSQNIYKQNFDHWFHHFKTPIFATLLDTNIRNGSLPVQLRNEECYVILNPCLKELEFYKVKDAFTCFQEIQQYISGVLTNTEVNQSSMTDKEKIISYGFDMKYGFRTRPKKK